MNSSPFRVPRIALLCVAYIGTIATIFFAVPPQATQAQQTYHNTLNRRFRTVSNGPQSGIIVDVRDVKDTTAVDRAVNARVASVLHARTAQAAREIALLRQKRMIRDTVHQMPLVEVVHLRQNGRLVQASRNRGNTRAAPASNDLQINIATGSGPNQFSTSSKTYKAMNSFLNPGGGATGLYQELKKLLGSPFSSLPVNILNLDPDNASTNISVRGVVVVYDSVNQVINIEMPTFTSDQDTFLGLAQALVQAFYVPNYFGYDAYSQGIARAVACIAAQDLTAQGFFTSFGTNIDPVDPVPGFYYTPYYDLLNQPALGTSSFYPPTPSAASVAGLAGMLVPRLQMASTVWTKCYIEDPNFFVNFNGVYYDAVVADPTVANNASRLRDLAASVLPNVEGIPFDNWYEQQYILDTSVTPGPKLFAFTQPTFPDPGGNAGASILLVYYNTTTTGDEQNLNGVVNPVYWDYTYTNRLVLSNGNAQEQIVNGFASASPFFTGIGDSKTGDLTQRLAIDLPVSSSQAKPTQPGGNEYVRVYFPANEESIGGKPTDFSGVYVGALSGDLRVSFNGGGGVLQAGAGINGVGFGAFSGTDPGAVIPTGFHKATLTFTPTGAAGTSSITFQRNTFTRKDNTSTPTIPGVSPVFVLNTGLSQTAISLLKTKIFYNGPMMVSLPFQPYQPYAGNLPLLFSLATGTPDPNVSLIAQYRQDGNPTTGKYLLYPSMPTYKPGYSFWTNFQFAVNNPDFSTAGQGTENQDAISVPLQFGWNMIGNPYLPASGSTGVQIQNSATAPGIQIQYQNGDALTLAEAVTAGYVATGVFGYNSTTASYVDITQTTPVGIPQNTLETWKGYWIRVLVTEGVTLTYFNPASQPTTGGGRSIRGRTRTSPRTDTEPGAWRMPLSLRDSLGNASLATLGQAAKGSESFVPSLDAASPPPFKTGANLGLYFPHADWDTGKAATGTGQFLSDIRSTGTAATWDVIVNVPQTGQSYVLNWSNTAKLPRGMRLTLVDLDSSQKVSMNSVPTYTFTPSRGATTRRFQIVAEPRQAGRLNITNLQVETKLSRANAAAGAVISYEISGAGTATIEIQDGRGHTLRHIGSGRAVTSGVNQAVWDLKDDQGRGLATGTYLIQITATTPEGERARRTIAHPITR